MISNFLRMGIKLYTVLRQAVLQPQLSKYKTRHFLPFCYALDLKNITPSHRTCKSREEKHQVGIPRASVVLGDSRTLKNADLQILITSVVCSHAPVNKNYISALYYDIHSLIITTIDYRNVKYVFLLKTMFIQSWKDINLLCRPGSPFPHPSRQCKSKQLRLSQQLID